MRVNVDNFVRAETDRMFADLQAEAGGVNILAHRRAPAAVEHQTVIRMNRDTLYSFAVVDVSLGARLVLPDAGGRYLSAMLVDRDHHVNAILHHPGAHPLGEEELGSPHVFLAVRILVDPADPEDVRRVTGLQDRIRIDARGATPFVPGEWDAASRDSTRSALLQLAAGLTSFEHAFGTAREVSPVRHLIGTAAGWGGLPTSEAVYVNIDPGLPVGRYELTMRDVPVDGFWSISVYDADGFFRPNPRNVYSVNDVTAEPDRDGSVTVRFGDFPPGTPNVIPIVEGWNLVLRLYRPRPAVTEGGWSPPDLVTVA